MIIPDAVFAEIRERAEEAAQEAIENVVQSEMDRLLTEFVDVTTMDDDGRMLMHKLTGRILSIKVEWID
jgi:hypothetical protein